MVLPKSFRRHRSTLPFQDIANSPTGLHFAQPYIDSLENTDYDWQYSTVPQKNLGDRVLDWPRGRVLGGSSAMNGLYL
jgi:choline dehydrogenase-like flavoprotein